MKQTLDYDKIQEQMKRGVITLDGFLGTDERKLIDIMAADDAVVRQRLTTHQAIAEQMKRFKDLGSAGLGEFITLDEIFEVKVESVRGLLPSPFGGPGMYGKINTTVHNKRLHAASPTPICTSISSKSTDFMKESVHRSGLNRTT
jgi:hypothetical protein